MKTNFLITGEATKYWKKAIKNDRVMVANYDGNIYILNGFNAFKMPKNSYIWDAIARPAFMVDMPESGAAFQYWRGEKQPAIAQEIAQKMNGLLEDKTPAQRLPFVYDAPIVKTRLYSLGAGVVIGVDAKYDSMVDITYAKNIYCKSKYSPVVIADDHFTALLMPIRMADTFGETIANAFGETVAKEAQR